MNEKNPLRTEKTTEPIVADGDVRYTIVDPEWAKVDYVTKKFQIGRTIAFRNIAKGTWKSVLLRDRDKKSGIRLIYIPSVRAHFAKLLKEQAQVP